MMAVLDTLQSTHKDPTVLADKPMLEGVDPKEDGISAASWGRLAKDVLNARNSLGQTPLMLACDNGCVTRHCYIVQRSGVRFASACHYCQISWWYTPLMLASKNGYSTRLRFDGRW